MALYYFRGKSQEHFIPLRSITCSWPYIIGTALFCFGIFFSDWYGIYFSVEVSTDKEIPEGTYKVIQVELDREDKPPLKAHFGAVPLIWNPKATLEEKPKKEWNIRSSDLAQRLLAQVCELCGSTQHIEVHHIRKLSDLDKKGQKSKPDWAITMSSRRRKSLILCRECHKSIHAGKYNGAPVK